jgi:hypothetical protein
MNKSTTISLLAAALLLTLAAPSYAWHGHGGRSRVFVDVGPTWGWGPPYPYTIYAPPTYAYSPPPVIVQQPQVYVQQQQSAPVTSFYCASARAYYPSVPTCTEAWIKVPPPPQ